VNEISDAAQKQLPAGLRLLADNEHSQSGHIILRVVEFKRLPSDLPALSEYGWLFDLNNIESYVAIVDTKTYVPRHTAMIINIPVVDIESERELGDKCMYTGKVAFWRSKLWGYSSSIDGFNSWPEMFFRAHLKSDYDVIRKLCDKYTEEFGWLQLMTQKP
jgi:hypothetical protein